MVYRSVCVKVLRSFFGCAVVFFTGTNDATSDERPLPGAAAKGVAKEAVAGEAISEEQTALNRALGTAASIGQTDKIRELIRQGADVAWRDPKNNGKTALVLAVLHGRFEAVKLLLESGADLHYPDGSGRYPIYFCCIGSNVELLQFLLDKGGDKDLHRGPFPILVSICDHGQAAPEFIPILIRAGADPNTYKATVTPLIAAIQLDPKVRKPAISQAYVKALVENKADVNLPDRGSKKQTPLAWAKQRGDQVIIDMLLAAGAKE